MTVFNPQFDTPDPSYLKLSNPIRQPYSPSKGDESVGIALKTLGSGIEEGVKLADDTIKESIKDDVYERITAKRQEFNDKLDTLLGDKSANPALNDPKNANAAATDQDLMPDQDPPPPTGVKQGLDTVQKLQNAREQSGKFRTTSMDADIDRTLKGIRAQWPGYKNYIDEQSSKILGYNVANKLVSDKIAQLNDLSANKKSQTEYWEKAIVNSGFSGSGKALDNFKQTGDIAAAQHWLAKNNEEKEKITAAAAAFTLTDKKRGYDQSAAEDLATKAAEHASSEFFMNRRLTQNSQTSAEATDKLTELSISPNGRDAEAIRNLGTQIMGLHQRNYTETQMFLKTVKTADGRSVYDVLGAKKVNEILDESINRLYNTQMKLLSDGNVGLVYSTQNAVADVKNNAALTVLNDPTTGGVARTAAALNNLAPNLSPNLVRNVWGKQPDYTEKLLNLSQSQMKQGLAQTGGIYDGGQGKIYTFKQALEEQDKAQSLTKETDQQKAEAIKNVMKLRGALTEKDPKAVDAGITFFFDPTNRGTMNKFMDDYYDKSFGVIRQGRTSAFQDLTSEDVTKSIWNRTKSGNGTAWTFYRSWAEGEAVANLTTMAKTWNINEQQYKQNRTIKSTEGDLPSDTDHHFYWNSDTHQIGVTDWKGKPINVEDSWRLNPDLFAVRNANIMLGNMAKVYATEGTDVNAALFRTMQRAGWTPEDVDVKGATIPDRIVKSVIRANTPPPKPKDTK